MMVVEMMFVELMGLIECSVKVLSEPDCYFERL